MKYSMEVDESTGMIMALICEDVNVSKEYIYTKDGDYTQYSLSVMINGSTFGTLVDNLAFVIAK